MGKYIYSMLGHPSDAIPYFQEATKLASQLYPKLSGNVLASAHDSLGRCYLLAGKSKEADVHFQKALEVRVELYGEDSAEAAESWHCLGNAAAACGFYEDAKELHGKALDMKVRHLGPNHVQVSFSLGMLATDHIDK
jgi:tetratricopeptide (TPR) repeat protein